MRLNLLPRTVRQKALVALSLVILLAIGNVSIVQFLLRESDGTAATLNVAGKMRMLSQRISLEALAGHRDPALRDAATETLAGAFEAVHEEIGRAHV